MRKLFTKEQEEYIRNNYNKMSYGEIAEHLSVTSTQITGWIHNHISNKRDKREKYSKSDEKFILDNYKDMTYSEMSKILGKSEPTIRAKAERMGILKLREFNKNYFNDINSELKAYFLGFIFADGWVIYNKEARNYEFGMELQSGDRYILDTLNNEIGGVHNITHIEPCQKIINNHVANCGHHDVLRIYSKDIVEGLMDCGIVPNKTYNYMIPRFPMKYFFDFLRGYIDGDGCYCFHGNNVYMSLVCIDKNVLEWIQSILNDYGIVTHIYKDASKRLLYSLNCTNKSGMNKLVNLMYHDNCSLYLTRKYDKIKSLLRPSQPEMIG